MTRGQQQGGALAKTPEGPMVAMVRSQVFVEQISVALPPGLDAERFVRTVVTAFKATPKLGLCDQFSVAACVFQLAQLGLEPNTIQNLAYLVPFKSECQVLMGYRGYIVLADRAKIGITARWVYEGDAFDYEFGTKGFLHHKPVKDPAARGKLEFAYCIAKFRDAREPIFEVLNETEVHERRARSQAWQRHGKDSPWGTDTDKMWRKSAVHATVPMVPMSAETIGLATAAVLDGRAERGLPQRIALPAGVEPPPVDSEAEARRLQADMDQARAELPADVQRPAAKRRPVQSQPATLTGDSYKTTPKPEADPRPGLIAQIENLVRTLYPQNGVARAFLANAAMGEGWKDKPVDQLRAYVIVLEEYARAFNDGNQPTAREAIEDLVKLCQKALAKGS